jgi:prepilin-type N-terminal cleavage/methylation domain-containing protein
MCRHRRHERGMTLLEIMIVLAIIALVMGLVVGPMVMNHFRKSKTEVTELKIKKLVFEAYPTWAATTNKSCPDKLSELTEYMNDQSQRGVNDAWDHPLEMSCNRPGVRGLAVWSHGEDGTPDTADDIRSWN